MGSILRSPMVPRAYMTEPCRAFIRNRKNLSKTNKLVLSAFYLANFSQVLTKGLNACGTSKNLKISLPDIS